MSKEYYGHYQLSNLLSFFLTENDMRLILEAFVESDYVKGDCTFCEMDIDGFINAWSKGEISIEKSVQK